MRYEKCKVTLTRRSAEVGGLSILAQDSDPFFHSERLSIILLMAHLSGKNGYAQAWDGDWWSCTGCGGWAWNNDKKCRACGMKKSFATVAANSARASKGHQSPQITSNLQAQLAELTSLLSGTTTPPHMRLPDQQDNAQIQGQGGIAQEDTSRAEYVEQIKLTDETLTSLPDTPTMAGARVSLLAEKDKYKKLIINSRPLGARLDGCKGAVARARKRQTAAIAELEQAQVRLAEANSSVTAKELELQELESQCAAAAVETNTQMNPENHGTCLDNLNRDMSRVLNGMELGGVDFQHVQACVSQMSSLFSSLTTLAKEQQAKVVPPERSVLMMLCATARTGDAADISIDAGNDFPEDWYSDQEMHLASEAKNRRIGGARGGS